MELAEIPATVKHKIKDGIYQAVLPTLQSRIALVHSSLAAQHRHGNVAAMWTVAAQSVNDACLHARMHHSENLERDGLESNDMSYAGGASSKVIICVQIWRIR